MDLIYLHEEEEDISMVDTGLMKTVNYLGGPYNT